MLKWILLTAILSIGSERVIINDVTPGPIQLGNNPTAEYLTRDSLKISFSRPLQWGAGIRFTPCPIEVDSLNFYLHKTNGNKSLIFSTTDTSIHFIIVSISALGISDGDSIIGTSFIHSFSCTPFVYDGSLPTQTEYWYILKSIPILISSPTSTPNSQINARAINPNLTVSMLSGRKISISITGSTIESISIISIEGKTVFAKNYNNIALTSENIEEIANGKYFVKAKTPIGTFIETISILR